MDSLLQTPERLSDKLAALLEQRIASGELAPEARLPTEQQLADLHGVSRTVVREAVSRLKSMGLLTSRQGAGVFVAPRSQARPLAFDPTVLTSLERVVQVVEVRRGLEADVAALAAERINPLLGRLGRASDDAAFYRALFEHLVDTAPVPEDGLAALADARARAIVEAVGAAESIDGARLATGDPRTSEAQEGRVGVQLALDVRPGS